MKKQTVFLGFVGVLVVSGFLFAHPADAKGMNQGNQKAQGRGYEAMLQIKATALGIPIDTLKAQLASGKQFIDILTERGISMDAFQAKVKELKQTQFKQLVQEGKMTQDQANARMQHMQDRQKGATERHIKNR